jgi:hypothetical protein
VLVSDETALSPVGVGQLSLSQDSAGDTPPWLDSRGYALDYSPSGTIWPPSAPIGLPAGASDAIVAGASLGDAEIAYSADPGLASREYLAAVNLTNYAQLAGGYGVCCPVTHHEDGERSWGCESIGWG